jgi:protein-tyrosine phosphatase
MIADAGRTDVAVWSAGTNAWDGSSASDGALLVAMERGLDLSEHRARQLDADIVEKSDLILVMAPSHLVRVKDIKPDANVHLLGGFAAGEGEGRAVQDPFGGDLTAYRDTFDELEGELAHLLDRIPAP